MRRALFTAILAFSLAAVLPETSSRASSSATDDFADLLKLAQCVAEVGISSVKQEPTSELGIPRAVATLKVLRCYKGDLAVGSEIECEQFGGSNGVETVVMPGQAKLVKGARALLLLSRVGASPWRVLGGELGAVEIFRDQTSSIVAQRQRGAFEFYVADSQSISGFAPVKSTSISAEQLGKLVELVLATGRPVFDAPVSSAAAPKSVSTSLQRVAAPPISAKSSAPHPSADSGFPFGRLALVLLLTTLAWLALRRR